MLNSILPPYTYRRMIVATLVRLGRGRTAIRQRLVAQNWQFFRRYRKREFSCNVCGERGFPFFDFPDLQLRREHSISYLRETLQCTHCGSTMRHRTLAAALLRVLSARSGRPLAAIRDIDADALQGLAVLDTDAFSPISQRLKHLPGYTISSFRPDLSFDAEIAQNYFNVNLEKMGFPSSSFDIVLTSDVMEHVRGIDAAHREIARVLKPAGHYVFTVPYDPAIPGHRILVDTKGPEDVFLVPPQYHGDPLSGGILAYRVFGQQLFDDLRRCGLHADFVRIDDDAALIVDGDAFIAERLPPPEATRPDAA